MGAGGGADRGQPMAAMANRCVQRRSGSDLDHASAAGHLDLRVSVERLAGLAHRPVEARPMSKPARVTSAHQSITFSRRMLLLGGAQVGIGTLLIGRLGWLAVAQNQK